jgi:DNA-directed RNA polymerase subunit RPC12/RpoP
MVKVRITTLECLRCGHRWVPKQATIRMCARCKSRLWNKPRENRQGMRTDLIKADRKRAPTRSRS